MMDLRSMPKEWERTGIKRSERGKGNGKERRDVKDIVPCWHLFFTPQP